MPGHRTGDGIIERRPAAAGLELLLGRVEGGVAGGAVVGALGGRVLVVLAGEGRLGALLANDAELSWEGLSVAKTQYVEHGTYLGSAGLATRYRFSGVGMTWFAWMRRMRTGIRRGECWA